MKLSQTFISIFTFQLTLQRTRFPTPETIKPNSLHPKFTLKGPILLHKPPWNNHPKSHLHEHRENKNKNRLARFRNVLYLEPKFQQLILPLFLFRTEKFTSPANNSTHTFYSATKSTPVSCYKGRKTYR